MARRKLLKAVAHNLGHSLASSHAARPDGRFHEHLSRAARRAHAPRVVLEPLNGAVLPAAAATAALLAYAGIALDFLPELLAGYGLAMEHVTYVAVIAVFDPTRWSFLDSKAAGPDITEFTVTITDDQGRPWSAEVHEAWQRWTPPPRSQSAGGRLAGVIRGSTRWLAALPGRLVRGRRSSSQG